MVSAFVNAQGDFPMQLTNGFVTRIAPHRFQRLPTRVLLGVLALPLVDCGVDEIGLTSRTSGAVVSPVVTPATHGCAMAHCDTRMSDHANAVPPLAETTSIQWHDAAAPGSLFGLGCSSNGAIIACTYTGSGGDNLVVYDASGARLWTSKTALDSLAWTSAPLITRDGTIIAADDRVVVRFGSDGTILWQTATPGGTPISPVVTASGVIVLATKGGPVSAYRGSDGALVGTLVLKADPADTEIFETVNTPCVLGDRVYVSTQRTNDPASTARLVAIDVVERAPTPLREAWHFEFGGPSGGSPLRVGSTIYFDGDRLHPGDPKAPRVFAVRDDIVSPRQLFAVPVTGSIQASPSQDPRGGFWVFPTGAGATALLHLDAIDGHEIERLDLDALIDAPGVHQPSSAVTMAGTFERPVMLVAATALRTGGASYVTALDLRAQALLWKVQLADARTVDWTASQFAIAQDASGAPLVVFPGLFSGAYAVGE
jgi:hypothetical protein